MTPELRASLAAQGYVCTPAPGLLAAAQRDPWALARTLVGEAVALVEVHPIRPQAQGRSFASNKLETPLHTDSQSHRGLPPSYQIMICERPASTGGETLLVDGWALLERIASADPSLLAALLERPRRLPFVFGDLVGPTLAMRGQALVLSHSPIPVDDEVGARLGPWIAAAPRIELALAPDDLLIVDNHRMLHGRRAFEDEQRRLLRMLVWSDPAPLTATLGPAHLREAAQAVRARIARLIRREPPGLRESLIGCDPHPHDPRLDLVLELLRGHSPGRLAQLHGVPERELLRWRDAALRGAQAALDQLPAAHAHDHALDHVRARLDRKLR